MGKSLAHLRRGRLSSRELSQLSSVRSSRGRLKLNRLRTARGRKAVAFFDYMRDRVRIEMLDSIKKFQQGRIRKSQLEFRLRSAIRDAMTELFDVGFWTGGTSQREVTDEERRWLKSAIRDEMKYVNKFIKDVVAGKLKMPVEKRVDMYIDTLYGLMTSARVIGAPPTVVINWVAEHDGRVCASCQYLRRNSPYSKASLPTSPRSGDTLCLTRCRCQLDIREVGEAEFERVQRRQRSKEYHLRQLRRIQRQRR